MIGAVEPFLDINAVYQAAKDRRHGTRWIERYLQIPWSDTDKGMAGTHCWGLIRCIYRNEIGIELPAYGDWSIERRLTIEAQIEKQRLMWQPVGVVDRGDIVWRLLPQAFDVVLFKTTKRNVLPDHVGMLIDDRTIINTDRSAGPHLIDIKEEAHRITEIRRYNG